MKLETEKIRLNTKCSTFLLPFLMCLFFPSSLSFLPPRHIPVLLPFVLLFPIFFLLDFLVIHNFCFVCDLPLLQFLFYSFCSFLIMPFFFHFLLFLIIVFGTFVSPSFPLTVLFPPLFSIFIPCFVSSILFTADAHFTLSRRTYYHHTRTQQPVLQWDYYQRRVVTGASIMREVTACQLLLASSLSGPIRLTSPYNSVTAKSVTVPLGISTSVLKQERRAKLKQLFVSSTSAVL